MKEKEKEKEEGEKQRRWSCEDRETQKIPCEDGEIAVMYLLSKD